MPESVEASPLPPKFAAVNFRSLERYSNSTGEIMRDRQEPTMGQPDMSDVQFRPHDHQGPSMRPEARPRPAGLTWQIAIGVFLGITMAMVAYKLHERHQMNLAIQQFNAEMTKLDSELARAFEAPTYRNSESNARTRRVVVPLRNGERCIQGKRLRRIPNGWEQINEPC